MKWAGLWLSCLVCVVACASPAPPQPKPTSPAAAPGPAGTPVAVQTTGGSAASPGLAIRPLPAPIASPSPVSLPLSVLAGRSGADVRVALTLLLQEQLFLSAAAMDAASSARLDELIGVSDSLDQNSLALAEVVGAVKGEAAGQALAEAWRGLVADLVEYAGGQQAVAIADLDRRRPVIAAQMSFTEIFTQPAADALLRTRIQTQLGLADAIASRNPGEVAQRLRLAAAASGDLARPLAAAISAQLPAQAPPPTEGLDIDVRLGLTRLLQEHDYLTGAAVDAAADGRPLDQQALVAAADDNATELGAQLGAGYGQNLGHGVADRVRAETASLVSVATGGDRRQAAADLVRLRGELDGLLSSANQLLPPGLVGQQLRASGQPLLTATDAFAARDYGGAFTRLREAAKLSQKAADSVARSLVDRYPGRYFVLPTPTPPTPSS